MVSFFRLSMLIAQIAERYRYAFQLDNTFFLIGKGLYPVKTEICSLLTLTVKTKFNQAFLVPGDI